MLRALARVRRASRAGHWAPLRCAIGAGLALAGRRAGRAGPASPHPWLSIPPIALRCPFPPGMPKPGRSLSPAPAGSPVPPPVSWLAIRVATPRQASTPGCTGIGSAGARSAPRRWLSSGSDGTACRHSLPSLRCRRSMA